MYNAIAQTAPSFPFEVNKQSYRPNPAGMCERDTPYTAPRMINSVVAEAGLGRFVYLVGQSGKRYVFSSITLEQATLYEKAVFACSKAGSEHVNLSPCAKDASRFGPMLYVHLLDEETGAAHSVIEDLQPTLALS